MNRYDIQYREQTASRDDIRAHLIDCDAQYRPSLSSRVDIGEYATKLFENAVTFEAWHQQALIGMVATYFNDATHTFGYITSVSVAQGYQGIGVASYLLRMCVNKAKRLDVRELRLEVASINNSALSLYRKFDFVEFASSTHSISMQLTLAGNTTS
jgi:ribosomal protein S18 acetylase RimI-like enzyme